MSTYPAAEKLANEMALPLTVCPTTRELYGIATPVLDRDAATRAINAAGFACSSPSFEVAMSILEERIDILNDRR